MINACATRVLEEARAPSGGTASLRAPGRVGVDRYLRFLSLVLGGYALNGRGFAYIGVSPLFIGELALSLGLITLWRSRGWVRLLSMPQAVALVPLAAWGAVRTVPYLSTYGATALRDAAIWGYGAYSWIVAGLLVADPSRLSRLIGRYRQLSRYLLLGLPVVAVVYFGLGPMLPRWPGPGAESGVPMVFLKGADAMIHFAGILAFWVAGFGGRVGWAWLLLMSVDVALLGVIDRAGLLAFGAVMGLCLILWPRSRVPWRLLGLMGVAALALWIVDIRVELPGGKGRQISFDQILTNFASMTGDIGNDGLDSTKTWRLEWWGDIVGYTFQGRYFWTGKGFGINLANDDGFQVLSDSSLRSPHNAHMTFLARTGVPGLALWALAQGLWGAGIFRAFLQSRRAGDRDWLGLFLFLGAFWSACLINASFDVYLEGPVGGIWFWSIHGAGLAALWIHRHCPEAIRAADPGHRAAPLDHSYSLN